MHMIRKGQIQGIQCVLSEAEFINRIMGIVTDVGMNSVRKKLKHAGI